MVLKIIKLAGAQESSVFLANIFEHDIGRLSFVGRFWKPPWCWSCLYFIFHGMVHSDHAHHAVFLANGQVNLDVSVCAKPSREMCPLKMSFIVGYVHIFLGSISQSVTHHRVCHISTENGLMCLVHWWCAFHAITTEMKFTPLLIKVMIPFDTYRLATTTRPLGRNQDSHAPGYVF